MNMDYKYIEQLLERYWQCQTSLEEEQILYLFFSQNDVPENLRPYQSFFAYERSQMKEKLGDDFDKKVLSHINTPVVKARKLTFIGRTMPMLKAAAMVAIIFMLGNVAQKTFLSDNNVLDYNYAAYKDTYSDPKMAYDQISSALQKISKGMIKSENKKADSLHHSKGALGIVNHQAVENE